MNTVRAKIVQLECSASITLVTLETEANILLQLLVIDTPQTASYLQKGNTVRAIFKETEVILALPTSKDIAIPNAIHAKISKLEQDTFLTRVYLESAMGGLTALVHSETFRNLKIGLGDEVLALVKMNEIMLAQ
ncbi:TOBE domain-containing protein [Flavimarina sp. Hel_I_48]|uniref:TOBE domain-containing protein n=1 Tax=Flavimarina sp. Hel_I_48 TaxID=1392488 RepID=UPI0004DF56FB|nr:TOBE domain-containing protein [Flavimarina sp. Hel_I_48]